ncbi:MAG: transposase family protein [Acetobacteraceae bacterium]
MSGRSRESGEPVPSRIDSARWPTRSSGCHRPVLDLLGGLEDPRTGNAQLHDFPDLLMTAPCTVPGGGQTAADMARFAGAKEAYLRGFLNMACPAAIPSRACSGCSIRRHSAPGSGASVW